MNSHVVRVTKLVHVETILVLLLGLFGWKLLVTLSELKLEVAVTLQCSACLAITLLDPSYLPQATQEMLGLDWGFSAPPGPGAMTVLQVHTAGAHCPTCSSGSNASTRRRPSSSSFSCSTWVLGSHVSC